MRTLLAFVLILMLTSCLNEKNPYKSDIKNNLTNVLEIDTAVNKNINLNDKINKKDSLYNVLYNLSSIYRSKLINSYFDNSRKIDFKKAGSNTLQFSFSNINKSELENISFLNSLTKKSIICFSGFIVDSSGVLNYFYFLQNFNDKWINISQFIIKNDIISLIEKKFNTHIFYDKISQVYAFVSKKTKNPFYFTFDVKNSQILYYSESSWKVLSKINFYDGKLSVISTNESKSQTNILNSDELENCKIYYNIQKAISDSQYVYILDFSSSNISNISSNTFVLKKIQILILDDNSIYSVSNQIIKLQNLQILRINNNNLSELPENIGKLPILEEVSASNNNLSEIPISLINSKSLRILNLDHNNLYSFCDDCSNLKNLSVLDLSKNKINSLPENFGQLQNLVSLDISNNPINYLPESFFKLKNLVYLNISKTNINDETKLRLMESYPDLSIVMD